MNLKKRIDYIKNIAGTVQNIEFLNDICDIQKTCNSYVPNKTMLVGYDRRFISSQKAVDSYEFTEQLQIAFQILLNRGYKIDFYPLQNDDIGECEKLCYVFQDENISTVGQNDYLDLIKSCTCCINFNIEFDILSVCMEIPFLTFVQNDGLRRLLETAGYGKYYIEPASFNAGILVEKIEKVMCDYQKNSEIIKSIFNNVNESVSANCLLHNLIGQNCRQNSPLLQQ